jgi:putative ABC transport system substrate-binding protein
LTFFTPELVGKSLELLKEVVPSVTRIAVLWAPGEIGSRAEWEMRKGVEVAAQRLGVQLQFVEAGRPDDLTRAFSEMTAGRAAALAVPPSVMFSVQRSRIVDLTARSRLPVVFPHREGVDAGGLMSYSKGRQAPPLPGL